MLSGVMYVSDMPVGVLLDTVDELINVGVLRRLQ